MELVANVFAVVADPTRRHVLELLRSRARTAGEIVSAFPNLTQPAVSRQLRVLREAGLCTVRIDRQRRIYALRAEGLLELEEWLAGFRPFWSERLSALEQHLGQQAAPKLRDKGDASDDTA